MVTAFHLTEALSKLSAEAANGLGIIAEYRARVSEGAGNRIRDFTRYKPELIAAYNTVLREFIEERFGELAAIGVSPKWHDMKSQGWPVKVTASGRELSSNTGNADAFGLASDYLINQIFEALLSDKGVSPGFRMIVEVAAKTNVSWNFTIRMEHFYKIPFKKRTRVPYPQFLDDVLTGSISYSKDPNRYQALGAYPLGLLGMTPAESEAIDRGARIVFAKILGAATSMKRGQM